jgi:hypothetical protein
LLNIAEVVDDQRLELVQPFELALKPELRRLGAERYA